MTLHPNKQWATFTWAPCTEGNEYWLSVGLTSGGSELYNAGNLGITTTNVTIYNVPTTAGVTLYATLRTRMPSGDWQTSNWSYPLSPPSAGVADAIQTSFLSCIQTPNSTCTLPPGTYFFGPYGTFPGTAPPLHTTLPIPANGVTIQGAAVTSDDQPRVIFARVGASDLESGAGCQDMIRIRGRSGVSVKNIEFDGGGLAHAYKCIAATGQPGVADIRVSAESGVPTQNILFDNVTIRNSIGHALLMDGQENQTPTDNITVQNSRFVDNQLSGVKVTMYNSWKLWVTAQYPNGCDNPLAPLASSRVPKNVKVLNSKFEGHWSGTVALMDSWNALIQDNYFINNYSEKALDGAGGTIIDAECVESSDWNHNVFKNWGIPESVLTSGFEMKGRGKPEKHTMIRNNAMYGQPQEAIDLASVTWLDATNNFIEDASRNSIQRAAIQIRNVAGWRGSSNISISGNTIQNLRGFFIDFGIQVGDCQSIGGATGCNSISNISIGSNAYGNLGNPSNGPGQYASYCRLSTPIIEVVLPDCPQLPTN
jgi:hypothetical protein